MRAGTTSSASAAAIGPCRSNGSSPAAKSSPAKPRKPRSHASCARSWASRPCWANRPHACATAIPTARAWNCFFIGCESGEGRSAILSLKTCAGSRRNNWQTTIFSKLTSYSYISSRQQARDPGLQRDPAGLEADEDEGNGERDDGHHRPPGDDVSGARVAILTHDLFTIHQQQHEHQHKGQQDTVGHLRE